MQAAWKRKATIYPTCDQPAVDRERGRGRRLQYTQRNYKWYLVKHYEWFLKDLTLPIFTPLSVCYALLLLLLVSHTLYQRRLQEIATLTYKVKNGLVPHYILELFQTIPKGYNLRNADFNIPRIRTTHYGKHSLRFFGPLLWGKLSSASRERSSLNSFKQSITIRKT